MKWNFDVSHILNIGTDHNPADLGTRLWQANKASPRHSLVEKYTPDGLFHSGPSFERNRKSKRRQIYA